jgi:hypothetical protein
MTETGQESANPRQAGRFWPWPAMFATLTVPVVLLVLLTAYGLLRGLAGWPTDHYQGWTLLGILLLSVLPIFLLILEAIVTSGGTLEAPGGVKLSFQATSARVASTVSSTTLSENLGTLDSEPAGASSMRSILRALRRSERTDVTVVDLRDGQTWWESRFFIVIASAARRPSNQAVAIVATKNEVQRSFIGWADPARLLELHLSAQPDLNAAYQQTLALTLQWQISMPISTSTQYRTTPWNTQVTLPSPIDEQADPKYVFELNLQQQLDNLATQIPSIRNHVTVTRIDELYKSVLVTDSIDDAASIDDWIRLLTGPSRRFFAMTSSGVLRTLVPRDALLAAVVGNIIKPGSRTPGQ